MRFRLDSWWFGVPLLIRGPLINLPVVLATDFPPIQVVCIAMILTTMMVMQMLAWPWKVPMLNATDCILSFCIVLLVTCSALYLNKIDETMYGFATAVSTAMLSGIAVAIGIMIVMTASALFYRSAMGGKKELKFFNLGSTPTSEGLAKKVQEMVKELETMEVADVSQKLNGLATFDIKKVTTCITLLATEVAPPAEHGYSFKFNKRIASASFDPMLKRKPQSLRSSKGETELAPKKDIEIKDIQQETETNNVVVEQQETQKDEVLNSSWM
ncbi:unnamed protein product [Cladocopium goreaui]|uniref:Tyrosine-protein kinase ephrin type A/B receptor-like domain-containing protein n=1 Tax=Cladocopium goreaui TaxID=2562237 RepID=A0A9P1FXF0_9DINO|nr:unnamed protein product [Cladocopium goreaui]